MAQMCLRLATIKGHSKMCSFTVLGGGDTHLLRIELIRLLNVACGMSSPLQWLCEVTGYWQELEHAVVYADPEHPKHAQWMTCPVSMLAMQELGCFQLPGIVYRSLQHGAVHYHAATWGDDRGWMNQQWATQVSYDDELQSCRDPDEDDEHAASLRRFLTVCVEILWLCKPIVAAAVRVAGLGQSWRCWMWRSWAGVVTRGLRLWERLDVLPNSLIRLWRRLMVEKWTLNSRATALVDIPVVSMPITRSLKTCNICGIVLCDKTAHFRVAFYCGQPKIHVCNNHAV